MLNQLVSVFKIIFAHHRNGRMDIAAGYGNCRHLSTCFGQLNSARIRSAGGIAPNLNRYPFFLR